MNYEHEVIDGVGLKKVTWVLCPFELTYVLDKYIVWSRKTTRHKFTIDKYYSRLDKRDSTLLESDCPMPEFVKSGLRNFVMANLKVCIWSEYKR